MGNREDDLIRRRAVQDALGELGCNRKGIPYDKVSRYDVAQAIIAIPREPIPRSDDPPDPVEVVGRFFGGESMATLAEECGVSIGWVERLIRSAVERGWGR